MVTKTVAADAFTRKATYPTLELRGIVGDYPMLYNYVDNNRKVQNVGGAQYRELVDVDIAVSNGETIRGFNYVNCRATLIMIFLQKQTKKKAILKTSLH